MEMLLCCSGRKWSKFYRLAVCGSFEGPTTASLAWRWSSWSRKATWADWLRLRDIALNSIERYLLRTPGGSPIDELWRQNLSIKYKDSAHCEYLWCIVSQSWQGWLQTHQEIILNEGMWRSRWDGSSYLVTPSALNRTHHWHGHGHLDIRGTFGNFSA